MLLGLDHNRVNKESNFKQNNNKLAKDSKKDIRDSNRDIRDKGVTKKVNVDNKVKLIGKDIKETNNRDFKVNKEMAKRTGNKINNKNNNNKDFQINNKEVFKARVDKVQLFMI